MQILHAFAWVVMFALFASVVTSLTLVPMLSAKLPEGRKEIRWKPMKKLLTILLTLALVFSFSDTDEQ